MKNIQKFVSKIDIKPVFTYVYVHKVGDELYAVATDSFRLAEEKLPFILTDLNIVTEGYYTQVEWKTIVTAVNKKILDVEAIISAVSSKEALKEARKDLVYPDYRSICKVDTETTTPWHTKSFNAKYLAEFIEVVSNKSKIAPYTDFSKFETQINGGIMYKDDTIFALTMPMNL